MNYIKDDKGNAYYINHFNNQEDAFKKVFKFSGLKKIVKYRLNG